MNKLIIFVLAVCLVSVHGFVRREAPVTEKNYIDEIQKSWSDISKQANDKVKEVLNPETIKKNFQSTVESLSKALEELKKSVGGSAAPKEQIKTMN